MATAHEQARDSYVNFMWPTVMTLPGDRWQWHQALRRCKAGPLQGSVLSDDVSLRTIQHSLQWHQALRRCKAGPLQGSVLSDDVSLRTIQHSLYGSVQLLGLVPTTWSAHVGANQH
ncbi:hypothetical protein H257_06879 [Aphanomyces astaci]|uniref:Uncharacterized protein n=1 Tax=Aphanomyces astaci TaxID=112090 RepID=W4GKS2_APHAT|nr:hypothetical protein H257_06879 [Aphanomyces astaci]ETV79619.1 hypothetical protein H257_06879 [Aphanomyces astaci]|eukprot:XP_009830555.1 hypothetical protein H257_06879 [Aphanomyces astaci]